MLAKAGIVSAVFTLTLISSVYAAPPTQGNRQSMVHDMGTSVMPFDLTRTQHIFEMTVSGGIQDVVARDATDVSQISLIRMHLQHEAELFKAGNYSDPTMLHGADMPGIKDLEAGAAGVRVSYQPLADGARIIFHTDDLTLLTAIHRWFGAQLSDHGADATYR